MELRCRGCGKNYKIGIDSLIVTSDDVAETFANAEQLKAAGAFSQSPDLVSTADTQDRNLMLNARHRGETIRTFIKMKVGQPRKWRCHNCDRINDYSNLDA